MARWLHVLGGGAWQLPTVRAAQTMGHRVLVTDMHAERPAYAAADAHEVVDLLDVDGTLAAARRHRVNGILCDTTDTGVATAATVAEALGLPGLGAAAARSFTDKGALRAALAAAGLPSPAWRLVDGGRGLVAAAAAVGLPLVVKPIDNQSGQGVRIVREAAALADAHAHALAHSRARRVVFEALLPGREFIVDSLSIEGRHTVLAIAAKLPYADNLTVSSRILYLSGAQFDAMAARIGPLHRRVLATLGARQGVFHAEYIVGADASQAVLIDIAARGGGVMIYTHAVPHVSGVDLVAASIRLALGEPVAIAPREPRRGASIDFLRLPPGCFAAIDGLQAARALPGVAAVHVAVQAGEQIGALANKNDRAGFVVSLAASSDEAATIGARAKACLHARMAHASGAVALA